MRVKIIFLAILISSSVCLLSNTQQQLVECRLLDMDIDLDLLQKEFETLRNNIIPRFDAQNDLWPGIPLKNALGADDPSGLFLRTSITKHEMKECYPTSFLKQAPYIQAILDRIEEQLETKVGLVRIFKLFAESALPQHSDGRIFDFERGKVLRLHIPIITSPGVKFIINDKAFYLEPGKLYYTNVSLLHQVINAGPEERIHLIIDVHAHDAVRNIILQSDDVPYTQVS